MSCTVIESLSGVTECVFSYDKSAENVSQFKEEASLIFAMFLL